MLVLDTLVDFSKVDVSPSFKICDSMINKIKKTDCFRAAIHQKVAAELQQHTFIIKDAISENVLVALLINSKGEIVLEGIQSSENIKNQLPQLDSVLRVSIANLPTIFAAIKRGIPVTTKYSLPIKIELKE
jgi:hypothetical protein